MGGDHTFRIGISMAGAVSAGAYTAGVMDYLVEALENWQKAKELNLPGTPKHQVVIEVLSGASAGGMTAVITAASIQKKFPHINQQNYFTDDSKENPLFHSWVNLTEVHKSDMMDQMLGTEDITDSRNINPNKEVRSAFNSLFIEKIAQRVLDTTVKDGHVKRPYFADDLELLTTLTNLRGFNYELEFITASGIREDHMTMHKDLVHLQLNPSGVYRQDGKIPFHFDAPEGLNKNLLIDAAIATGAFPAGLAPRVIIRDPKYINDNHLLRITHGKNYIVDPLNDYHAVCVDGGVINNEPYDLTETILTDRRLAKRASHGLSESATQFQLGKSASTFDTTVLMIDPFPNYDENPSANYFDLEALKFTIPKLFGAMRQQLMVKTDLLEKAYADDDNTRFMIAPIRTKGGITRKYPLACGALGGFGGFFSKKFRIHDYMLGRRNCQRFIQQYFCVPVEAANPIIEFGYENFSKDELKIFWTKNKNSLPIIPDIRLSPDQKFLIKPKVEEEFFFPSIGLKYLMGLEKKVQARFGIVFNHLPNGNNPDETIHPIHPIVQQIRKKSWFIRNILGPIEKFAACLLICLGKKVGKKVAAGKFIDAVVSDMDKMGLLRPDH